MKRPIEAAVIHLGRSRDVRDYEDKGIGASQTYARVRLTAVTINVGAEHGAVVGLKFRVRRPAEGGIVRVVSAGRRTSGAVVIRSLDERGRATSYDNGAEQERAHTPVRAGWKLTTSLF